MVDKYYFNKYDIDYINGGLFYVAFLVSCEHTSCTLLDPMTEEGKPNMKLLIKLFIEKITVAFLFTILVTGEIE